MRKPQLYVNWAGLPNAEKVWKDYLLERENGGKSLTENYLRKYLPERLAEAIAKEVKLEGKRVADITKEERKELIERLVRYPIQVNGNGGYKMAEVTGGGIDFKEVDTSTLESKKFPGLYFLQQVTIKGLYLCGEILDVFGRIGGFNFYWAWTSGRLAGLSAVQ